MNTPLQKLSLILPLNGGVLAVFIYCGASSDVLWNILPGFLCLVFIIHGNGPVWFDLESNKSSFHGFWLFLAHCIVCNYVCGGNVIFHGCHWLLVAHFTEGGADMFHLRVIVKKGSNLCLCIWSHHMYHYVWYCVYSTVCFSSVFNVLGPHMEIPSCSPAGLEF